MHLKKATKYVRKKQKVLQIEPNTTYGKYNESAHMFVVAHPISRPHPSGYWASKRNLE
jgi:hypothetical protein